MAGCTNKAWTPPPLPSLMAVGLFFLFSFSLKISEKGFRQLYFLPTTFGLKRAIFFAKYCNIPVKRPRLCQHCQYWYFDLSSQVKYLLFSYSNKIRKKSPKNILYFPLLLFCYFFCAFPNALVCHMGSGLFFFIITTIFFCF